MTCYSPLQAYHTDEFYKSGKRRITFDARLAFNSSYFLLPCGQCTGCRLERSRQWAIRCMHEAQLHDSNCFITLTYSPDHLPSDRGLNVKHFQDFMKRFRFRFKDSRIRFYHCGEYGETYGRPHYHACIFGFDFPDKELFKSVNGINLYTSQILSDIWGMGFVTVGEVTFESAAYVARYIMKKVNGDAALEHYLDKETGVLRKPEYTTMSRRPGIGRDWFDMYKSDVFPHDFLFVRGRKVKPPKYYDSLYEIDNPDDFARIKEDRAHAASLAVNDSSIERLRVKEVCKKASLSLLPRNLE